MDDAANNNDLTALSNVMHEIASSRSRIRDLGNQINRSSGIGRPPNIPALRTLAPQLVEELDSLDALFEFLRIELNPGGIEYAPLSPVNVQAIFFRAVRHYSGRMQRKELSKSEPDRNSGFAVEAYPSLAIVPMILIDNATKYAPKGSAIAVGLDANCKTATVESMGPKIENDEMPLIFDRGFRGRNAKALPIAGQGLGLYIARQICAAHGFEIRVTQHRGYSVGETPYATLEFLIDFRRTEAS
jgi:K+-sensing histidine kinase KdpD